MSRSKRKAEHIELALETGQLRGSGFEEVAFLHRSIPDTSHDSIELKTRVGELALSSPIFINAMTGGGGRQTYEINRDLAIAARETGVGLAVGSQMSALKNREEIYTYEVVRKENPDGIVFSNLGSEASVEQAKEAVKMVDADALQIHLNVVQELTMPEGDRDFRGVLHRIEKLVDCLDVPVIVKETGFGMSMETVEALKGAGVLAVDVSGYGGTNFGAIENRRRAKSLPFFEEWGIPTAVSVVEAKERSQNIPVIASGGIQSSLDIAKSLALGAEAAALAGYFLKVLSQEGRDGLIAEITSIKEELKMIMTALGANTIKDLQKVPLLISGHTWHWLDQRGIDTKKYAQRT
ncbi:isopentenyl pyrophosphate isomerase [Mesobacillus campisalis]|uniref:Isopentenyl-diphosphate delta-isomerase n=1 Tax=Mesobacillus campisalis TaxID=1408103 RepID=A0A0M2SX80_9BACI|nr:type 2 isopentenyl-diphosphate Delta-isomerase [Mesobacillus campisalis]KKK37582.1 isopentenyl pyrophosphate isomerase [Mesobacillus campisalis]